MIYPIATIVLSLFLSTFGFIGISHYLDTLTNQDEIKKDEFWLKVVLISILLAILTCQGAIIYNQIYESNLEIQNE